MVICLGRGADLHMAHMIPPTATDCLLLQEIQIGFGFTFLVLALPGTMWVRVYMGAMWQI